MTTHLGKYHLRRKLGAGGMGEVWEAVDTVLDRSVAVKLLTGDGSDARESVREAAAAARVNHPNAVSVYDAAECDGRWLIVMELVDGPSALKLVEERGPLLWAEATRIARDAAAGLAAVHAAGLIHRDVKPANILLTPDGTAKVADFGLARTSSRTTLTAVVGTPHYMSPEQCWNETADGRADVYSLGATYFTLLTARPPFAGDTPMAVMYAHCHSPVPDPRAVCPAVPAGCAAVVRRAMAKAATDRFASADDLRVALDALLAGAAVPEPDNDTRSIRLPPNTLAAPPLRRPFPTRRVAVVGCVGALAAAALTSFACWPRSGATPPPTTPHTTPTAPPEKPAWFESVSLGERLKVQHLAVAPDGRSVAVAVIGWGEDDTKDGVYLLAPDGRPVPGWPRLGRGAESVAFSPDGTRLAAAFRPWGTVQVWELDSGRDVPPAVTLPLPLASRVAFSADGQWLAAGAYSFDGSPLVVWQRDGARGWRQPHKYPLATECAVSGLTFIDRADQVAVLSADGGGEDARATFRVYDTTTGQLIPGPVGVEKHKGFFPTVAAAPGVPLVAVSSFGQVRLFNAPDWKLAGDPLEFSYIGGHPVLEPIALAFSPDGHRLAAGVHDYLVVWRTGDRTSKWQTAGHHGINTLAFTPDGATLLTGSEDGTVRSCDPSAGHPR